MISNDCNVRYLHRSQGAATLQQGERKPGPRVNPRPEERARLIALIDEATVDAHDESEQALGLYAMISESLVPPFKSKVLGRAVSVVEIESGADDQILAICEAGGLRQRIGILELVHPASAQSARNGSTTIACGAAPAEPRLPLGGVKRTKFTM